MGELNLPQAPLTLRQMGEKKEVFDVLRARYVALTPEEWVRQNFVHYLMNYRGYPKGKIGNEVPLKVGHMQKRCDSIVYGKHAQPLVIIEYKAPSVEITQITLNQIWRYNLALHVPYLFVSNGVKHYFFHIDYENHRINPLPEVPEFARLQE